MNTKKVDLKLSILLEDLNNGYTWFKKENVGYGSIQEKYNAADYQIEHIRKHPQLKDVQPNIVIFNIIDDVNIKEVKTNKKVEATLFEGYIEKNTLIKDARLVTKEENNDSALFLNI